MRPFLFLPLLLLAACTSDQEIKVYRLAKEPSLTEISWSTPLSWKEQPAQGMRSGSFLVTDANGSQADISMIFLEGKSGGILANVNRWRQQIGLTAWSAGELMANKKEVPTTLGPATLVDFSNGTSRERIVVAMLSFQQGTWFFKMKGDEGLVGQEKGSLLTLLATLLNG